MVYGTLFRSFGEGWLGVLDEVRTILLQGRSAFAFSFAIGL